MVQNRYDARNGPALTRLLQQGVKLVRYSDDILKAARTASEDLFAEQAAKEAAYKKVFEHWDKTRKEMFTWWGTTERAYGDLCGDGEALGGVDLGGRLLAEIGHGCSSSNPNVV